MKFIALIPTAFKCRQFASILINKNEEIFNPQPKEKTFLLN